jgi:hypothetical protein
MSERISNTFNGGMKSDLDKRLSQQDSYLNSKNGRLIYNENGNLCWENTKGNVNSIANYDQYYKTIGVCEFPDFVVVFSKYAKNAYVWDEIGIITFSTNGDGLYKTLHTDNDDEFKSQGSQLNFNTNYPIQARAFYESDEIIRTYFTDDFNEPRVFTFKKESNSVSTSYTRVTKSEFTMNLVPDFQMGELEYQGIINGGLRSGIYQYSYRLKTDDGYETPWTPITFPIPITGRAPIQTDNNSKAYDESAKYGMADVDVIGVTGNRLLIRKIDQRYDTVEVAYVHSITKDGNKEAGIFFTERIKDGLNSAGNIDVFHVSVENIIPINNIDALIDFKDVIVKAKTIEIHDNRLWLGNTESKTTFTIPDSVLDNFYVEPEFRAMPVDLSGNELAYTGAEQDFKAVNVKPESGDVYYTRRYRKYGSSTTYAVKGQTQGQETNFKDYQNYQGAIPNESFKGYFRGERYRFAIVFYDKKGYPFFAKHFADVSTPQNSRGYYRTTSVGNGFINALVAVRVKDDGTTTYREVEVGNLGATQMDSNFNHVGHTGTTQMKDLSSNYVRGMTNDTIESKYKIATNSPTQVGVQKFRPTRTLFNNPNNNHNTGGGSEKNTSNFHNTFDVSFTRILGFRFGGIDLNVVVDDKGTKLKDIVGGVQIVRVDRNGADEQVKDQGIVVNLAAKATGKNKSDNYDAYEETPAFDDNGVKMLYTWPSPILGGAASATSSFNLVNIQANHIFKDKNESDGYLRPATGKYSFFGVNALVSGQYMQVKQGITSVRTEHIVAPSNIHKAYDSDEVYSSLQDSKNANEMGVDTRFHPRHYTSKLLHTMSHRVLYQDTPNEFGTTRWIQANLTYKIKEFIPAISQATAYGLLGDYKVYNECWLGRGHKNDDNEKVDRNFESLALYTKDHWGNKTEEGSNIDSWYYGTQADSYYMDCDINYLSAFSNISNSGSGGDYAQHLACWVVSIVEPNSEPYGGYRNEAIQNSRFHTTGHYLNINEEVLEDIEGGDYVLNELEVWGGDCILDVFAFPRVLPAFEYLEGKLVGAGLDANDDEVGESWWSWLGNDKEWRDWSHGIIMPVESKFNYRLTYKDDANGIPTYEEVGMASAVSTAGDEGHKTYRKKGTRGLFYSTSATTSSSKEQNFQLQDALNYEDIVRASAVKPLDFIDITDHPNRWHWSNLKQPHNAKVDKFRQFEEISNRDIDANFGEITGVAKLQNKLYSFQSKAFGRMRVNERAVAASDIGDLQLGEGGTMDGLAYISNEYGTQHRDSIAISDKSIYWIDSLKKKVMRFGGDGMNKLSDIKQIHTFIESKLNNITTEENIINGKGIISTFDYGNNDVYFTIKRSSSAVTVDEEQEESRIQKRYVGIVSDNTPPNQTTLIYNEDLQLFQTTIDAHPTVYFRHSNNLYSNTPTGVGGMYRYNEGVRGNFFGNFYDSYLSISINHQSRFVKKFDTALWNVNPESLEGIKTVTFESEGLIHKYDDLSLEMTNLNGYETNNVLNRVKYREGLLRFPIRERDSSKQRLTGKSATLDIVYDNSGDKKISLANIDTAVRYHYRK